MATDERPRIGISACLLGERVRYDGQHRLDHFLSDTFGRFVEWVPVCPEVECGLPVPRDPMHLEGDPASPRLVVTKTGRDLTARMTRWATRRVKELAREDLCGFVFKSKSPSSGMARVEVFDRHGMPHKVGVGLFARAFIGRFPLLPVEDEGRLSDPRLRENFIERIFCLKRYRDFLRTDGSLAGLAAFHADHKMLLMAHSAPLMRELGRLAAQGKGRPRGELLADYEAAC